MMTKRKRGTRKLLTLATIFYLTFWCLVMVIQTSHASKTQKSIINPLAQAKIRSSALPLIDTTTPAKFETASFGLG